MSAKTSISARIDRMVDSANSKVKAVASVTIGRRICRPRY